MLATAGAMGLITGGVVLAARRRRAAFCALADRLGLPCAPKDDGQLRAQLEQLPLIRRAYSTSIFLGNVIRGQYLGVELAVFEYRYQQPPIPTRHARHTTVVCVRRPGLELPCFLLHPRRGWLDKPTTLSRAAQITFPSSPLFSRTYELRGYAEGLVRRAFTPAVRQVFEEHQDQLANHCVEGLGDTLLFYAAAGRMTSPPALELIAVAARVAHQLCAAERVHPS